MFYNTDGKGKDLKEDVEEEQIAEKNPPRKLKRRKIYWIIPIEILLVQTATACRNAIREWTHKQAAAIYNINKIVYLLQQCCILKSWVSHFHPFDLIGSVNMLRRRRRRHRNFRYIMVPVLYGARRINNIF